MSSPVIGLIERLLQRGEEAGKVRAGIDPLNLYVAMVSLAYYGNSPARTLSRIFETDLSAPQWQAAQAAETRACLPAIGSSCELTAGLDNYRQPPLRTWNGQHR